MNQHPQMNDPAEILASIRESLSEADLAFQRYGDPEWPGQDPEWPIQTAFLKTRIFLEAAGLSEALKAIQEIEHQASANWLATVADPNDGEMYLSWGLKLRQFLRAIEPTLGRPEAGVVTKEVIQILRATQYSITDRDCFPDPPADENDVHVRIEAVLRCIFPDLLHKPPIQKQIKNFQPDTGLPSIYTLIEYKFIGDEKQAKQIADEILADTRGYVSTEWQQFIYVIYETKRIKSEKQWRQLLRESGVGLNTEVIVISGEEPTKSVITSL
jgi:hypothetical protein